MRSGEGTRGYRYLRRYLSVRIAVASRGDRGEGETLDPGVGALYAEIIRQFLADKCLEQTIDINAPYLVFPELLQSAGIAKLL